MRDAHCPLLRIKSLFPVISCKTEEYKATRIYKAGLLNTGGTTICLMALQCYKDIEKSHLWAILMLMTTAASPCGQNLGAWQMAHILK